ncbi:MAG: ABC transporter substrate-binding protein [Candidatus Heimdallarchaeota archaeon]
MLRPHYPVQRKKQSQRGKGVTSLVILLVTTVIFLAGCIGQEEDETTTTPIVEKVRLAYLRGDLHHLAFFVALDQGWYEEVGLDVETPEFENGMQEMLGFGAGAVDIGYLGIAPSLVQYLNAQIDITAVTGVNQEGSAIIVRTDPNIQSIADLAGKKFAIPGIGTVQHFLALMALEQHGLSRKDLSDGNFIETSVINMEPALQKGSLSGGIDAFIAWEPFDAKAVGNGVGRYLIRSREIWPHHPCCVIAVRTQFLEAHPEVVQKVVTIHAKATNWILEHPGEAASIFRKFADLPQEVVELAMENIEFIKVPDIQGIRQYLEKLIEYGVITEGNVPADIDTFLAQFINEVFLEEALKTYP